MIGARIERRAGREHGRGRKVECPLASRTLLRDAIDVSGGGTHGVPVNAALARDDHARVELLELGMERFEKLQHRGIRLVSHHRRADVDGYWLLTSERREIGQQCQSLL